MSNQPYEALDVPDDSGQLPGLSKFKVLRIWPAALLLVTMLVLRFLPKLIPDGPPQLWMAAAFGPLLASLVIVVWWLAASRATWKERMVGFVGLLGSGALVYFLLHESMPGPPVIMLTIPMGAGGFAIGAVLFSRMLRFRRTVIAVGVALCCLAFSLVLRSDGMWGDFGLALDWRWNQSAEEKLLAAKAERVQSKASLEEVNGKAIRKALLKPEWTAFRGTNRSGHQTGTKLLTDWSTTPPKQLWKVGVGPAWSSFAVAGKLLFTQEQRGEEEMVVCYGADTGAEIWSRGIKTRLDDPLGGPGPRATPTIANGAIFTLGSTGALLKLDGRKGTIVWRTDLCDVADIKPPMWGFCSSPLVVGTNVIVHVGEQKKGLGIIAFDTETGKQKWSAPAGKNSYSSPQLSNVGGEDLVAMISDQGLRLLDPTTGKERLAYEWKVSGYRSCQPQMVGKDSMLIPSGLGAGTRRIRLASDGGKLTAKELWTSRFMKPDFNDMVVCDGHIYGFDQTIFACIDLETGKRKWKGGRYGKGQALLLSDCGIILVVTEKSEVVLVQADPEKHTELARFKAIEGKAWNHPVVIGDRLYIRNGKEAACYQLPTAKAAPAI